MCTCVKAVAAQAVSMSSKLAWLNTVRCWSSWPARPTQGSMRWRSASRWASAGTGSCPAGEATTNSTRVSSGQTSCDCATRRVSRVMHTGLSDCSSSGWPSPGQPGGDSVSSKGSSASSLADSTSRRWVMPSAVADRVPSPAGAASPPDAPPWRFMSAVRPGMPPSRSASRRAVSCS